MKRAEMHRLDVEAALIQKYLSISKISLNLYQRACKVFPSGSTRRTVFYPPYPAYITKGEGCKVYDADGNEYIDYTNNYGPLILGHRHPRVLEAIRGQLECGTVLGGPTELEIQLAERILESLPCGEQVLFTATGTEANMVGLRALRAYTGKDKIVKCVGAYHGTSDAFVRGAGVPKDVLAQTVTVPFNDAQRMEEVVKQNRDELAAVFIEPILRGIPPKPGYLKEIRRITKDNEVLLAFDEVVTGFRLSRGGAQEKWGVVPDMTLLGKIIGGGLAVGAIVASEEILGYFRSARTSGLNTDPPGIFHGGTFHGHPVAMAAGLATLEELTPRAYLHLDEMGHTLMEGMSKAAEKAGIVAQVVGVGSVFNIYFTDQSVMDFESAESANTLLQRCFDLNMIVRSIYPAKAHCSFVSTPVTHTEVNQTIKAVEDTLISMKPLVREIAPHLT